MKRSASTSAQSLLTYFGVWVALVALTLGNVASSYIALGPFNLVINLVIAFSKAFLVTVFLMQLRLSGRVTQLVAVAGFFWLLFLFSLTMADYTTRPEITAPW